MPRSKKKKHVIWKWWEEGEDDCLETGVKWKTLEHSGPCFPPPYQRLPENVPFYYGGIPMTLSNQAEEAVGFYAMTKNKLANEEIFKHNFFEDWKKVMIPEEREVIKDLEKCNFKYIKTFYKMQNRNRMSVDAKQARKTKKRELTQKYGSCKVDGRKQKVDNFIIKAPGIFVSRSEHPKRGMLKRRVEAEDIVINIGEGSEVPDPPPGHQWKEVCHDNTALWLARWTESIWRSTKYVQLSPMSEVKCKEDWEKFKAARKLKDQLDRIREDYGHDLGLGNLLERQTVVALYFMDKLPFTFRTSMEDSDGTRDADCCSLKVGHVTLHREKNGHDCVVTFDFWGEDGIRYEDSVAVEWLVFRNLERFVENKQPNDDLFGVLNSTYLNEYMGSLMKGLTVKVFRSNAASQAMQEALDRLTTAHSSKEQKLLAYNQANRDVALLCNHKLNIRKGFSRRIRDLQVEIGKKEKLIKKQKREVENAENDLERMEKEKELAESRTQLETWQMQLEKLEILVVNGKMLNLNTSKLNYLDPRITVAWCKKWSIPVRSVFGKKQRIRFRWAIETAEAGFRF